MSQSEAFHYTGFISELDISTIILLLLNQLDASN